MYMYKQNKQNLLDNIVQTAELFIFNKLYKSLIQNINDESQKSVDERYKTKL